MTKSTWNTQPATNEWNTAENWSSSGAPTDTAEFAASSHTAINFTATSDGTVENIEFTDDAPTYTFTFGTSTTPALTITGQGITNRSAKQQSFIVAATTKGRENPQLMFINSATAGGDDIYYCAGPENEQGYGGGVISFCDNSTAGSASFKIWTGAAIPPKHHTVGGEISFSNTSSAATARFTIYGSLGIDGDTFGNVVFHDNATAAKATFTNVGGTVSGGDGGNTQFYGSSTAAYSTFINLGGTHSKSNGGDVAFDSTATGEHGHFYNYAAKAAAAYGGVTSFNNNPPHTPKQGANAGNGSYFNYGAREGEEGGGGHMEFSAKYGSPTAANATITNYGSTLKSRSSAGHTIFSISLPNDHDYYPSADNATIWNHPGMKKGAAAGYTEFAVFTSKESKGNDSGGNNVPTAGDSTLINLGGSVSQATGGYTVFSGTVNAGNTTLIAHGGTNGGYGGRIMFSDSASGGAAKVQLSGNGELDIGYHTDGVTICSLDLAGGIIVTQLSLKTPTLTVTGNLSIHSNCMTFSFKTNEKGGFACNTPYTILTNANLCKFKKEQFSGNSIESIEPTFSIVGNDLQVTFSKK
jgi:hypothetical protein